MSKALKERLNKPFGLGNHSLRSESFKEPLLTTIIEKKNSVCDDDFNQSFSNSKEIELAAIDKCESSSNFEAEYFPKQADTTQDSSI